MVTHAPVTSSNIAAIGYEEETQTLHVTFKGGARYTYADVPASEHEAFMSASSKGKFFADNIKDQYATSRG